MQSKPARKSIAVAVFLLLAALIPPACASIAAIGVGSEGESFISTYDYSLLLGGWFIGPTTVNADPDAGPWVKKLAAPEFPRPLLGFYQVIEVLQVGEGPAWNGWHEEIRTDDWAWVSGSVFTFEPPDSFSDLGLGSLLASGQSWGFEQAAAGSIGNDLRSIDFDFDPFGADTWLLVAKTIRWTGGFCAAPGSVEIAENMSVVPLPGAAWMLASGLIGLVVIRRRSSR